MGEDGMVMVVIAVVQLDDDEIRQPTEATVAMHDVHDTKHDALLVVLQLASADEQAVVETMRSARLVAAKPVDVVVAVEDDKQLPPPAVAVAVAVVVVAAAAEVIPVVVAVLVLDELVDEPNEKMVN